MTKTNVADTTVLLILDACRRDYIDPELTPFMAKLKADALTGEFESPPGFAQRTTMFTGTYPDTSGNFSAFGYNPDNSPFKWVRKLGPLRHLHRPRKVMYPARLGIKAVTRWATGAYHTDPAWIPATFLPYFEVVEDQRPIFDPGALPHTSVFDLCRDHGEEFFYGAHPVSGDDDEIHRMLLERFQDGAPNRLHVAQFSALDEVGHHHGPHSAPIHKALAEIDRKVQELVDALERGYDSYNLLILGDHGMAPVRREVNLLKELSELPLEPGDDYVVFLDSTFAKLWFHNERAEAEIRNTLAESDAGWILTDEDRKRLRIDFDDRRYGDLMFAANAGVLFWPDYFHVVEHTIRGMHGYIDKRDETYGALLLRGPDVPAKDVGRRMLVDVFPTLCDLTGLPATEASEGQSLLGA